VEILFPERRNEPWLNKGWMIALLILFIADVLFGHFLMTPFRPEIAATLITLAVTAVLIIAAWHWPKREPSAARIPAGAPFFFWIIGFIGTLIFFIMFSALPAAEVKPIGTILIAGLWTAGCSYLVVMLSRRGASWDDRHRVAVAFGILSVFILLAPVREFGEQQGDNPAGMTLVGALSLALLLLLWWKVRRRYRTRARS
jgi:hypothetical protein